MGQLGQLDLLLKRRLANTEKSWIWVHRESSFLLQYIYHQDYPANYWVLPRRLHVSYYRQYHQYLLHLLVRLGLWHQLHQQLLLHLPHLPHLQPQLGQ